MNDKIKEYINGGNLTGAAWKSFSVFASILAFRDFCAKYENPEDTANRLIKDWKDSLNSEVSTFEELRRTELASPEDTEQEIKDDISTYKAGIQDASCDVEMVLRRVVNSIKDERKQDED